MIEREESMVERVAAALHQTYARQESDWRVFARAAIEAMREPTDEMARATGSQWGPALEDLWHQMIDAALKEGS